MKRKQFISSRLEKTEQWTVKRDISDTLAFFLFPPVEGGEKYAFGQTAGCSLRWRWSAVEYLATTSRGKEQDTGE